MLLVMVNGDDDDEYYSIKIRRWKEKRGLVLAGKSNRFDCSDTTRSVWMVFEVLVSFYVKVGK